jgi:Bacterial alpha-L-rhamnosidase 6 hairpin glycosidase domain
MGSTRREFVKLAAAVAAAAPGLKRLSAQTRTESGGSLPNLGFRAAMYRVEMAADQPGFVVFTVDSLGTEKLDENLMLPLANASESYKVYREHQTINYSLAEKDISPVWTFDFGEHGFVIRSTPSPNLSLKPLVLSFRLESHATLLGLFSALGTIHFPAILHIPHHGTFSITTAAERVSLGYDAVNSEERYIRVSLPAAQDAPIEYRFDVADIYPEAGRASIENDPRFDAYRRDFLSILQLNPRRRILANNIASDACAFTVFEYSMMAIQMPPLCEGMSALDILRQTLDRYVGGVKAAGMKDSDEYLDTKYDLLDTYPSLVMATSDYVQTSGNTEWLKRNYSVIKSWADKMIDFDRDDDGLMEHPTSGNSGSWTEKITVRGSNWWDTIGFGHKDAYSNALAYKAFRGMEMLSRNAGYSGDAETYKGRAEKLKGVFYHTFYNPATGVLAGWKSADGKLHDYYFLFINGMAVVYGLVTREQGNQIWGRLMAKMKEVGYDRFDLGLPGNLIPVRREDYVDHDIRFGGGTKADGSDGFQIYENGGATACMAYFTIQALRELGRHQEAESILFPILKAFEDGKFQGRASNGLTYDWTDWDGNPHGYEGLLVDNYLVLLAAMPASPHN